MLQETGGRNRGVQSQAVAGLETVPPPCTARTAPCASAQMCRLGRTDREMMIRRRGSMRASRHTHSMHAQHAHARTARTARTQHVHLQPVAVELNLRHKRRPLELLMRLSGRLGALAALRHDRLAQCDVLRARRRRRRCVRWCLMTTAGAVGVGCGWGVGDAWEAAALDFSMPLKHTSATEQQQQQQPATHRPIQRTICTTRLAGSASSVHTNERSLDICISSRASGWKALSSRACDRPTCVCVMFV